MRRSPNDGNNRQQRVEQSQTDNNIVIVHADSRGEQATCTGNNINAFGDDRADKCEQNRARDTVNDGDCSILEDMLAENSLSERPPERARTDVVGVHLVDHVAAQPLHQVTDGGKCEGDNGQNIHQPCTFIKVEGCGHTDESAESLNHEDVRKGGNGETENDINHADLVTQLVFLRAMEMPAGIPMRYARRLDRIPRMNEKPTLE